MARCTGKTKAGKRCRKKAVADGRCAQHASTGSPAAGGRPTILEQVIDPDATPPVTRGDRILAVLRAGAADKHAAAAAGVSSRALELWQAKGREHDPGEDVPDEEIPDGPMAVYVRFVRAATRARGEAVATHLAIVNAAARGRGTPGQDGYVPGDWRAAKFLLEARHPEEYGKRLTVRTEDIPDDPAPIDTDELAELEDAERAAFGKALDRLPTEQLLDTHPEDG